MSAPERAERTDRTDPTGLREAAAVDPVAALLWRGAPPPRRGPKPRFSVELIAATGVALADAEGLDAVTMHRVADRLGTTKMALYRYVPGRLELDALLLDLALGEPPAPDVTAWQVALTRWANHVHARATAHPWCVELVQRPHVPGPHELSWYEAGLATVSGLALTGSEKLDALVLVVGHVMSVVRQTAAGTAPEQDLAARLAPILADRAADYPHTVAAFAESAPGGPDDALRFGIERAVAGIEVLAATRA